MSDDRAAENAVGYDGDHDDFSANGWLDNDYQDRADAVLAGGLDGFLDAIEAAETSKTVTEAVEARREEIGEPSDGSAADAPSGGDDASADESDTDADSHLQTTVDGEPLEAATVQPDESPERRTDPRGIDRILVRNAERRGRHVAGLSLAAGEVQEVRATPRIERALRRGDLQFVRKARSDGGGS